jgi:hypothetical protein
MLGCHFLDMQDVHHGHPSRLPPARFARPGLVPAVMRTDLQVRENGRLWSGYDHPCASRWSAPRFLLTTIRLTKSHLTYTGLLMEAHYPAIAGLS